MAELKNGNTADDPRLGRVPLFDQQSRNYQVRGLFAAPAPSLRSAAAKYWTPGPTLDQLNEGQCVAEAAHDRRNGAPLRVKPTVAEFSARREFYHACQHRDPWEGCYLGPDCPITPSQQRYGGTAILTAMQLGKERGWWSSYRWIGAGSGTLEADIIDTLRSVGGIVFGIPWYDSMYVTRPDGLVEVSGRVVGGHAIHGFEWIPRLRLPKSFSGTKPAVAWHNSWGDGYGVTRRRRSGVGFILLDDLLKLLEDNGEGAVPLGSS